MRAAIRRSHANWALLVIVCLPPLCTGYISSQFCTIAQGFYSMCDLYVRMPMLVVNLLWLLHVDFTFYIISLVQVRFTKRSTLLLARPLGIGLWSKWYFGVGSYALPFAGLHNRNEFIWNRDLIRNTRHAAWYKSSCQAPFAPFLSDMYVSCLSLQWHDPHEARQVQGRNDNSFASAVFTCRQCARSLPKRDSNAIFTCPMSMQDSTWLIDPYWTLAPPFLLLYWVTHPSARLWTSRQVISCVLLPVWSIRLTHSYFRREGWYAGVREDWRYSDMKEQCGRWWPFVQVRSEFVHRCMPLKNGCTTCTTPGQFTTVWIPHHLALSAYAGFCRVCCPALYADWSYAAVDAYMLFNLHMERIR